MCNVQYLNFGFFQKNNFLQQDAMAYNINSANARLILRLIKHDIEGRYQGSILGIVWSLVLPLLMLLVYAVVVGKFLNARWPGATGTGEFALILFPGLMVFSLFSECLNRAPALILGNKNYVKKVVFPLMGLVFIPMGTALFHLALSFFAWILISLYIQGTIHWTIVFFPIVILPILVLTLGLSWFLGSLGVYVRDVAQIMSVVTQILMYLSPVLYPLDNVPKAYVSLLMLNPLTFIVEQSRIAMNYGGIPDLVGLGVYSLVASVICALGYTFFRVTKHGFADVI